MQILPADHVVIGNQMIHDARAVPLDGRPRLPAGIRRLLGDWRGRGEGRTLVVETSNFSDLANGRGSGDRLRLIERFTRADAKTLLYEFTVDNPASFVKPWTAILPMAKTDNQIYDDVAHEANYAMTGILRGARAKNHRTQSAQRHAKQSKCFAAYAFAFLRDRVERQTTGERFAAGADSIPAPGRQAARRCRT